jgi:hypothetical protein
MHRNAWFGMREFQNPRIESAGSESMHRNSWAGLRVKSEIPRLNPWDLNPCIENPWMLIAVLAKPGGML